MYCKLKMAIKYVGENGNTSSHVCVCSPDVVSGQS